MSPSPRTLFDKLWRSRLVHDFGDGRGLIHIDRHLLHDLSSPQAFAGLRQKGRAVRAPELAMAVPDHIVDTHPGRGDATVPRGEDMIRALRTNAHTNGIRLFDIGDERQGIVHVVAAENGFVLPGMTVACGDSHTCTLGALGCWAFGIGTSDVEHILATQTLEMRKPVVMRLVLAGARRPGTTAKDLALAIIARLGVDAVAGGVLEITGPVVQDLLVEERFTLCNMGIEASARSAIIAPDARTVDYVRAHAGHVKGIELALAHCGTLFADDDAAYDREWVVDCSAIEPQITWGTNPGQATRINGDVPDPAAAGDDRAVAAAGRALDYMGLVAGQKLKGLPIDAVFIGSCTNGRLSDLEDAARFVAGRKVASGIRALVVPGSSAVKRAAEAQGLDRIFGDAGFEWREAGCSMCVGMNADKVGAGERCVSTSNRNFEGRQGPGARTHLASPATAAVSALAGAIAHPMDWLPT